MTSLWMSLVVVGLLTSCNPKLDWVDPSVDDQVWEVFVNKNGSYITVAGNKRSYQVLGTGAFIHDGKGVYLYPGECMDYAKGPNCHHNFLISKLIKMDKRCDIPQIQDAADKQLAILKKQGIKVE